MFLAILCSILSFIATLPVQPFSVTAAPMNTAEMLFTKMEVLSRLLDLPKDQKYFIREHNLGFTGLSAFALAKRQGAMMSATDDIAKRVRILMNSHYGYESAIRTSQYYVDRATISELEELLAAALDTTKAAINVRTKAEIYREYLKKYDDKQIHEIVSKGLNSDISKEIRGFMGNQEDRELFKKQVAVSRQMANIYYRMTFVMRAFLEDREKGLKNNRMLKQFHELYLKIQILKKQ